MNTQNLEVTVRSISIRAPYDKFPDCRLSGNIQIRTCESVPRSLSANRLSGSDLLLPSHSNRKQAGELSPTERARRARSRNTSIVFGHTVCICGRYRLSRRKQLLEEQFAALSDDADWSP